MLGSMPWYSLCVFLLVPPSSCPRGEDILQVARSANSLPAAYSILCEPSCCLVRLLNYSLQTSPCGLVNCMAERTNWCNQSSWAPDTWLSVGPRAVAEQPCWAPLSCFSVCDNVKCCRLQLRFPNSLIICLVLSPAKRTMLRIPNHGCFVCNVKCRI